MGKHKRKYQKKRKSMNLFHKPRQQNSKTANTQENSQEKDEAITSVITTTSKIEPAPLKRHDSDDCHQQPTPWYWRLLEGIGIVFGIIYAIVALCQWRDLRQNFEVDQRAWLKVVPIFPQKITIASLPIKVSNVGKSVASRASVDAVFEIVESSKTPSFSLEKGHTHDDISMFFPTDQDPIEVGLEPPYTPPHTLTEAELGSLARGDSYIAVFGRILYRDQFGLHWTIFCAWHSYTELRSVTVNARPCVAFNAVGDGKPPQ
jgi:hypothetical protein